MKKHGFTLIELLIVIAIIGILAAAATTAYIGTQKSAARSEAYANLQNLRLLEEQFFAENATYAGPAAGTVAVQGLFARFQPGAGASFDYSITNVSAAGAGVALTVPVAVPYAGATTNVPNPSPPCFIATATGILGTRVCPNAANCDVFAIDCMNNRNF